MGVGHRWELACDTFLFVCSLNSKDAYSGFGDPLSAILNLTS